VTDHLSALALDEAAAALPLTEPDAAHLTACPDCQARLVALKQTNDALLASPAAQRTLAALAPPRRAPRLVLLAGSLALAAGLSLWLTTSLARPEPTGLKGALELVLLTPEGVAVTHAAPGESLDLGLGGAGHTHATVFAVDAAGGLSTLFTGALRGGAREKLTRLRVTPGDVLVLAFFADDAAALTAHERTVRNALATTPRPLELNVPGALRLRLEVRAATP
jgi:hypothetical protein